VRLSNIGGTTVISYFLHPSSFKKMCEVVTAVGIDIDVDAIHIANANAADNNVAMRSYLPPLVETADDVSKSLMLKAHAHAAGQLRQRGKKADDLLLPTSMESATYHVVVANRLGYVSTAPWLMFRFDCGADWSGSTSSSTTVKLTVRKIAKRYVKAELHA
jgi:hypothetical protein